MRLSLGAIRSGLAVPFFLFFSTAAQAQFVGLPSDYPSCLRKGGKEINHKQDQECKFIIDQRKKNFLFKECAKRGGEVVQGLATICAVSFWKSGRECPDGRCNQ